MQYGGCPHRWWGFLNVCGSWMMMIMMMMVSRMWRR